jgi:hypothetical protein
MVFLVLRNFVVGWIAGHAALTEVHMTRAYVRLGENELDIDLVDLSPLSAFAHKGQCGAISWLVASSLVSLFWFGPTSTSSNGLIVLVILVLVTLVFFRPIYGAHQGIRRAKQAELGALREELRLLQAGEREAPGMSFATPESPRRRLSSRRSRTCASGRSTRQCCFVSGSSHCSGWPRGSARQSSNACSIP